MSEDTPLVTRMERPSTPSRRGKGLELPPDLLRDSARRLRVIALIYAGGFVLGEGTYAILDPVARADYAYFYGWGPPVISILVALVVAVLASSSRIPPRTIMNIGLAFEVVAAYGIAAAAYWGVYPDLDHEPAHLAVFGLSYVAPWIMFFTIVSPCEPKKALFAAIAAGSSVPVVLLLTTTYGTTSIALTPNFVANNMLVPWVLIVVTAYVGARVVYKLGTAVTRARELGSYRLTERLGKGGMGEVWQAKHQLLARPAAVKLIRPDACGGDGDPWTAQRRFEREAQATALLSSPHTIDVYDFGVTNDGTFYYVMELMHGYDLETFVKQFGAVPPDRVVYLLRQVCESLAEAHQHDLIHRDIKPANIYLCRRGRPVDFVKVLDFGLVKLREDVGERDIKLTAADTAGGTPAYMAPEQACGDPVDARTDIYALGCVAHWLLTGRLVFEAKTPMEMLASHLRRAPLPPSRTAEVLVPTALDAVILRCLEKDPKDRPQCADELDDMLAGVDVGAVWTPVRARAWWDAHEPEPPDKHRSESRRALMV